MSGLGGFFNDAKDYVSFRRFLLAAGNDNNEVVESYLNKNPAAIDRQEALTGNNALMCATIKGAASTVKRLLERGASLAGQDKNGFNILHMAVLCSSREITNLLLQRADITAIINEKNRMDGVTALMCAAMIQEDPALVKSLLEKGADPGLKDYVGRTALSIAKANGYTRTVALLEEWQAKPKPRRKGGRFDI